MRVKVVTVINNYGEEKFIVKYTSTDVWLGFIRITTWYTVKWTNSDDPFFYSEKDDALHKASELYNNGNPLRQRVVAEIKEEEITL